MAQTTVTLQGLTGACYLGACSSRKATRWAHAHPSAVPEWWSTASLPRDLSHVATHMAASAILLMDEKTGFTVRTRPKDGLLWIATN